MDDAPVIVVNPLSSTLEHYVVELIDTLRRSGQESVEVAVTVPADAVSGPVDRLRIMATTVSERWRMGRDVHGRTIIVTWPLFGYLDPVTLIRAAKTNRVIIVVHDPTPLRKSYGYSAFARRTFRWITTRMDIRVVYHTALAQGVGVRECGVVGEVIPHPLLTIGPGRPQRPPGSASPVVRVLGQYKPTRSLAAMRLIADRNAGRSTLEVHGRGWPAMDGWTVADGFIADDDFASLLHTSDCVVIPYDSFFQSGVAVRCLELGLRVVAPRHEHIIELYGEDWPGLVDDDDDWHDAIGRVLAVDTAEVVARRDVVGQAIQSAWADVLGQRLPA